MDNKVKPYRQGLILGRFQLFHKGHARIVDEALANCDNVLILIGSAQASGTLANPFSYETRESLIRLVYGDKVKIAPLTDLGIGNVTGWGDYVIASAEALVGTVDCFVMGEEAKGHTWFSPEKEARIARIYVSREEIAISGTRLREALRDGDQAFYERFVPHPLGNEYGSLRRMYLEVLEKNKADAN